MYNTLNSHVYLRVVSDSHGARTDDVSHNNLKTKTKQKQLTIHGN